MTHRLPSKATLTLLLLLSSTVLSAQSITYIDATHGASGNTFESGKPIGYKRWVTPPEAQSAKDNQWIQRTDGGNGDTIYQASIQEKNTIPELTTQLTGLSDGTYDIWVFAWDSSQYWQIDAGLTSGALTTYQLDGIDAVDASQLTFEAPIKTKNYSNKKLQNLVGIRLGQVVVSGGNAVNVYIDSSTNRTNAKDRTWYDGVGYARVESDDTDYAAIPEPAVYGLLLGLVAISGLGLRRRNKRSFTA